VTSGLASSREPVDDLEVCVSDQMLVTPSGTLDPDRATGPAHGLPVGGLTATARDADSGRGLDRCAYALDMLTRLARETLDAEALGRGAGEPTRVVLSSVEAQVVAQLLDELAGVYPGELLAQLAGSLSARLWERVEV